MLAPGNLFINVINGENDTTWDYVNNNNTGDWTGWYLRNNHPIGIQDSVLDDDSGLHHLDPIGSANYSGFPGTPGTDINRSRTSSYDFGSGLDTRGHDIIIGWAMTCANDVVYERINNPVPEPTTLLLLGLGLIGIAAIRRKYKS
jgi:hypothetical protein